jgi:Zn-dependent metalloprotease
LGGELIVQTDSFNNILSANGEIIPEIRVNTSPSVSPAEAQGKALTLVLKYYSREFAIEKDSLKVSTPELWIYNPILLGVNRDFTHLVWRMEVSSTELLPIRELVLIDAHLGNVVLHFNQIDTARNRLIYDHDNISGKPLPGDPADLRRTEGQGPSGIADVDNAYDYAGDTYDFYLNYHGRDSIDGAGMDLVSTTRFCPNIISCPYVNAFWAGSQMVYGEGFASADDVVGHEMTHGVTTNESNLFYYMQSGAINEALSDIWGELIDLTNGKGDDTAGVRWLLGEDLPIGAIRNMKDPTLYGDPDRMGSPNYVCGTADSGGVHYNSGVANKTAYLLTDGDTFNGYTVIGLGIDKVADLFYEVQTNLFTSGSDYQDLYDALVQAAVNLGFSASDRQQVQNAVDATEMNQQPSSCPAPEAPILENGSPPLFR